jgi:hypothetical protein
VRLPGGVVLRADFERGRWVASRYAADYTLAEQHYGTRQDAVAWVEAWQH